VRQLVRQLKRDRELRLRRASRGIPDFGRNIRCIAGRRVSDTVANNSNNNTDMASGMGAKVNDTVNSSNNSNSTVAGRISATVKGTEADSRHGRGRRPISRWGKLRPLPHPQRHRSCRRLRRRCHQHRKNARLS
jgi:hypothetical protein